jgi:hypothetical protein
MTEPERTGYRESPDTTDGPVTEKQVGDPGAGGPADEDATLTTDDAAQREDSVARPGNEAD